MKNIDKQIDDKFATLDEASTELAAQLGKRYEDRLIMRERLINGLSAKGRLRRNAPCPCGSGKKFKKCCYRDFKNKMNERINPTKTSEKETTDDAN